MITGSSVRRSRRLLAPVVLLGAVLALHTAAPAPSVAVVPTRPQPIASSGIDELIVAPGRIGSLRMGTSAKKARKAGWISYGECGWDAGRRAVRLDADGDEVFKAYPDRVSKGKVRSMHAMGAVVSTKGIRARGIGKQGERLGSTLDEVVAAYPKLRRLGSWQDYLTDQWWPVYTTGSKKRGWLDFYLDPASNTVILVQVRAGRGVRWGQPQFGC